MQRAEGNVEHMNDGISTADLFDELGDNLQSVSTQFQNLGGRSQFSGPVRTVRCHRDNALVKQVLSEPGEGAVLVIDGGGALESALVGDIIAQLAVDNGWAGLLVYGVIRDRVVVSTLPIGVKALGSNPKKSSKTGAGEVDATVTFGGVTFRPGAMLFSDEDGILVEN
jgi:regulator of ribonuclease activity A